MTKTPLPEKVRLRCRALRKNSTDVEALYWEILRNRRFGGWKFRRQAPLYGFIPDFYCHEAKLVIELDGGQHLDEHQARYDTLRSRVLGEHGIRVLRFWNHEAVKEMEIVLSLIWEVLEERREAGAIES